MEPVQYILFVVVTSLLPDCMICMVCSKAKETAAGDEVIYGSIPFSMVEQHITEISPCNLESSYVTIPRSNCVVVTGKSWPFTRTISLFEASPAPVLDSRQAYESAIYTGVEERGYC
jgi:hypothetical protein